MPGVKGRTGTSPKTGQHKRAIAESVRAYWNSPEGVAERARRRQAWRQKRLAQRLGKVE